MECDRRWHTRVDRSLTGCMRCALPGVRHCVIGCLLGQKCGKVESTEGYRSGHNGADSKSDGRCKPARGFESHLLRQLQSTITGYKAELYSGTVSNRLKFGFPGRDECLSLTLHLPCLHPIIGVKRKEEKAIYPHNNNYKFAEA